MSGCLGLWYLGQGQEIGYNDNEEILEAQFSRSDEDLAESSDEEGSTIDWEEEMGWFDLIGVKNENVFYWSVCWAFVLE